jgi:hypothetical protein
MKKIYSEIYILEMTTKNIHYIDKSIDCVEERIKDLQRDLKTAKNMLVYLTVHRELTEKEEEAECKATPEDKPFEDDFMNSTTSIELSSNVAEPKQKPKRKPKRPTDKVLAQTE